MPSTTPSDEDGPRRGLNKAQARSIRASFVHVSDLLDGVLKVARDDLTAFDRIRPDLSQAEARRLAALVTAIRERMLEALATLGIPAPEADGSARWSARTAFLFAEIALEELSGRGLRGYGSLDAAAERDVAAVAADLGRLVKRAQDLLRGVDPASVEAMVERVEGAEGEALRQIWRFAADGELVDVYPDIAAVAERAAAPAADVGVFGRTNAGKSSLINALVGQDVLPVGSVPVTAIPLRLARGPASLRLRHEGGRDEEAPLEELHRFTLEALEGLTETDVTAIDALVPTAPAGLRFIDTPGVGSYASPVGARAFEWLPRCDLGLLLVPAGSIVEAEDVALARGLLAAGVEVKVLLSKADLASADELEASTRHVQGELARRLRDGAPEILAVSVALERTESLEALRRDVLAPLAAERARSSGQGLKRRLLHLVALVESALQGQALGSMQASTEHGAELEDARRRIEESLDELRRAWPEALQAATVALARAWTDGRSDPFDAVESSFVAPAEAALESVRRVLEEAGRAVAGPHGTGPSAMPPLFDFQASTSLPSLREDAVPARVLPRTRAARRLSSAEGVLTDAYSRYADRLRLWSSAMLAAFAERAVPTREASPGGEIEALHAAVSALGGES